MRYLAACDRTGTRCHPAIRQWRSRAVQSLLVTGRRCHHLWGWGAYERGWAQVEPRPEWAAARWHGGHTNFDLLALGTSGALAYTIWIEHGSARLAGIDEYRPILLRVTHLYRQEGDTWKIIHRHADALSEKIPVAAVLLPEGKELS